MSLRCIFGIHDWKIEHDVKIDVTRGILSWNFEESGILQLLRCKNCRKVGAKVITASNTEYINYDYAKSLFDKNYRKQ